MSKKVFQELFVDSLASFICIALKEKAKTKINIKFNKKLTFFDG